MRGLMASMLALVLLGCNQHALLQSFVPKDEAALAKKIMTELATRDYPAVETKLDKRLQTPEIHSKLVQIAGLIPAGEPKSIHVVGAYTNQINAVTYYSLTFEYEYSDRWLVANVMIRRSNDAETVTGIHVEPYKQSLETENAFHFEGKSWLHFLVFGLAIAIPLFIIYAIVVCARTRIDKRKWLWLIFIALGLSQFQLNWTTGALNIQPLSFLLLGVGFMKAGPAAPLVLSVAFPLGAVVFLARRRSFRHVDGV